MLAKLLDTLSRCAHLRTGGRVMARQDASDLAHRLGRQAEAVCRHYLSSGRREGGYWLVGDVRNTPGRSMYVRLNDSPKGLAGKWTDAATGEAWRSPRRHPRKLRPGRLQGRGRRSQDLPQHAATGAGAP